MESDPPTATLPTPRPAHSCSLPSVQPHSPLLPTHPHLLAEMSNATDLEGASRLHILILEEDRHAHHLGQCPALQQRCDDVEVLTLGTLRQRALHPSNHLEGLQEGTNVLAPAAPAKSPCNQNRGRGEGEAPPLGSLSALWLPSCEAPGKCLGLSGPQFHQLDKDVWTKGPFLL